MCVLLCAVGSYRLIIYSTGLLFRTHIVVKQQNGDTCFGTTGFAYQMKNP